MCLARQSGLITESPSPSLPRSVIADEKMSEIAGVELTHPMAGHHSRRLRGGARQTLLKVGQVKEIYEMKGAGRSIRGTPYPWDL